MGIYRFAEHFPRSISCYICPQKVSHFSSNSFRCNVNNEVSIKSESRTMDCGLRTGYKRETKVSGGLRLRTTDHGLRTTDGLLTKPSQSDSFPYRFIGRFAIMQISHQNLTNIFFSDHAFFSRPFPPRY